MGFIGKTIIASISIFEIEIPSHEDRKDFNT